MIETGQRKNTRRLRRRIGLVLVTLGLGIFTLGVLPDLFGADRSPVVGFVQIAVFLVGLAMICLGGIIALNTLWDGQEKTIAADFGYRMVSTGYVIAVACAMADMFGFGSQTSPAIPYFGQWQALGVILSEFMIVLGFLLMIPWPRQKAAVN